MHHKTPGWTASKVVYAACREERESPVFLLSGSIRDNGSIDVFATVEIRNYLFKKAFNPECMVTDWRVTVFEVKTKN